MWLAGMMGSGRSTVGEAAAAHIGVRFVDTDARDIDDVVSEVVEIWGN